MTSWPSRRETLGRGCGTSARRRRRCAGTGSRRRGRSASPAEITPVRTGRRAGSPVSLAGRCSAAADASMVVERDARPRNYRALARMAARLPATSAEAARRYFLGAGRLSRTRCPVRTPAGVVAPDAPQQPRHVHRERGVLPRGLRVPAERPDRGGHRVEHRASARSTSSPATPACRCWLYEPVPRQRGAAARQPRGPSRTASTLREVAVAAAPGRVSFGVEDSGRYGGIGVATGRDDRGRGRRRSNDGARGGARGRGPDRRPEDRHRGHRARAPARRSGRTCSRACARSTSRPSVVLRRPYVFSASFRNDTWCSGIAPEAGPARLATDHPPSEPSGSLACSSRRPR